MKKTILGFIAVMISSALLAQTPQLMSYQAVVRKGSNQLLANAPAGVRVSILQGSASGTAVYSETHTVTTNAQGLANLSIGGGTAQSGTFAGIDWANGPYFLKTETDPTGGTNYSITATSQLMSVPYALYSERSATPGPQGPQGVQGPPGPSSNSLCYYTCPTMFSLLAPSTFRYINGYSLFGQFVYNYREAKDYCSNLVEGGFHDWRVPTLAEYEYVRDVLNVQSPISSYSGSFIEECWTKDFPIGTAGLPIANNYTNVSNVCGIICVR